MNPRYEALKEISSRKPNKKSANPREGIEQFGKHVFNKEAMKKFLPKLAYQHITHVMETHAMLDLQFMDAIANGMKDWAVSEGATHYTHWFQTLSGLSAEKHDAFIDWDSGMLIEKFSGKMLLRGEPDASSFPSGGLRSTFEARGYTTWDPTSPAFLWKSSDAVILCIPSFFLSWTGEALDLKIPLMRSDAKINDAGLRLLKLLGIGAKRVFSTLGCEQEFFLVDRSLYELRPDLVLTGRTLLGAAAAKEQELEANYFRSMKERILSYVQEFETEAYQLGIPLKTRHGEVAPGQFEVAPIYEKSHRAVDHNLVLMEIMREVAERHDLICLFHEKPFAGINGSGKHNNWSLATDTGLNLLDPTDNPAGSLPFLIMVTAVLHAVHKYAGLLLLSVASAGNDHRLGGHEAPPAIISVFLGHALEEILESLEKKGEGQPLSKIAFNLQISSLPELSKDYSDRNRTSPFAFTGNKFEFRAVGSSANCAFPVTVLNVIVAEELNQMVSEIESLAGKKKEDVKKSALEVVRKYLLASKKIRFLGDNYSQEWIQEAKKRDLPTFEKSFHAFSIFNDKKTVDVFHGVLSREELRAHHAVTVDAYSKIIHTEAKLLIEMFQTQVLPCALEYQKNVGKSIEKSHQEGAQALFLKKFHSTIDQSMKEIDLLEEARKKAISFEGEERGKFFCDQVGPRMEQARKKIDELETLMDDRLWPLPKYRELLFVY